MARRSLDIKLQLIGQGKILLPVTADEKNCLPNQNQHEANGEAASRPKSKQIVVANELGEEIAGGLN